MIRGARIGMVVGLAVAGVAAAALMSPWPQPQSYHRMADARRMLGIPNALNVLSNLPFVLAGLVGLTRLAPPGSRDTVIDTRERWPYAVFFAGLILTGVGSAYYHLAPSDARLVWDRLPLAITIMGLLAAVIAERVSVTAGLAWLGPLTLLGIASVLHWQAGMTRGGGDLRLYGLVQFYPMAAVPLLIASFPPRYTRGGDLVTALGLYVAAKLFEALDEAVLAIGHVVSGHTIKHLLAATSGYWVARMLAMRAPASRMTRA